MIVIGMDPGKLTGIAVHDGQRITDAWEAPLDTALDWLAHRVAQVQPGRLIVASERFIISGGTTRKSRGKINWSIEGNGVARALCRWYYHKYVDQDASAAKNFAPNDALRGADYYVRGCEGHANDAIRHVLLARANELNELPPWA